MYAMKLAIWKLTWLSFAQFLEKNYLLKYTNNKNRPNRTAGMTVIRELEKTFNSRISAQLSE